MSITVCQCPVHISEMFLVYFCYFEYGPNDGSYFTLTTTRNFSLTLLFLLRSSLEVPAALGGHRDSTVAKVSLSESLPEEEEEEEVRFSSGKITLCFNNSCLVPSLIVLWK